MKESSPIPRSLNRKCPVTRKIALKIILVFASSRGRIQARCKDAVKL
jgi:hypothetical protein